MHRHNWMIWWNATRTDVPLLYGRLPMKLLTVMRAIIFWLVWLSKLGTKTILVCSVWQWKWPEPRTTSVRWKTTWVNTLTSSVLIITWAGMEAHRKTAKPGSGIYLTTNLSLSVSLAEVRCKVYTVIKRNGGQKNTKRSYTRTRWICITV